MRLLHTATLKLEDFSGRAVPPYSILSHTWEGAEVSHEELRNAGTDLRPLQAIKPKSLDKIRQVCRKAIVDGQKYIWIDSCCIDKSSSAELSKAINSMFKWYRDASVCYTYICDYDRTDDIQMLRKAKWFTRGFTLQELIAPSHVKFYDLNWEFFGTRHELQDIVHQITNIDKSILRDDQESGVIRNIDAKLASILICTRMSWAANRNTTQEEDIAYCLFGIFDVNMPLLYGEGPKAFRRLQEEIVKSTTDLSLFAWQHQREETHADDFYRDNSDPNNGKDDDGHSTTAISSISMLSHDNTLIQSALGDLEYNEFNQVLHELERLLPLLDPKWYRPLLDSNHSIKSTIPFEYTLFQRGIFASHPSEFMHAHLLKKTFAQPPERLELTVTNKGVHIPAAKLQLTPEGFLFLTLNCGIQNIDVSHHMHVGILLRHCGEGVYERIRPEYLHIQSRQIPTTRSIFITKHVNYWSSVSLPDRNSVVAIEILHNIRHLPQRLLSISPPRILQDHYNLITADAKSFARVLDLNIYLPDSEAMKARLGFGYDAPMGIWCALVRPGKGKGCNEEVYNFLGSDLATVAKYRQVYPDRAVRDHTITFRARPSIKSWLRVPSLELHICISKRPLPGGILANLTLQALFKSGGIPFHYEAEEKELIEKMARIERAGLGFK